jgi:hypothetical protein
MFVSPAPRLGDVVIGRDVAGRALRVSAHPHSDRVVLSIWQDATCLATFRLAPQDVPGLLRTLGCSLVVFDEAQAATAHHPLAS